MLEYAEVITDLLLGAAYADREFVGHEVVEIRSIVSAFYGQRTLPPERVEQIKGFDPDRFDVSAAAAKLADLPTEKKMEILSLVNQVVDADAVLDLDEDAYLASVAKAMGLTSDEVSTFTEEVNQPPPAPAAKPPPLPED